MSDTLHFERYEYKYLVPEDRTEAVRHFIRPYAELDEHSAASPNLQYTIHNLYLDTPNLDFFMASMTDQLDRYKLRIRWYGDAPTGPCFFEVKRKIRQVILKDRAKLSPADYKALVRGEPLAIPEGPSLKNLAAFRNRMEQSGAVPALFVRYTREAYESVFGEYARLTFDRAMCWQRATGWSRKADPRAWSWVDGPENTRGIRCAALIELKFTRDFPRWMSDLVAEFDLERVGYSKYFVATHQRLDIAHGDVGFERRSAMHSGGA
jgi:hypothetical protein